MLIFAPIKIGANTIKKTSNFKKVAKVAKNSKSSKKQQNQFKDIFINKIYNGINEKSSKSSQNILL